MSQQHLFIACLLLLLPVTWVFAQTRPKVILKVESPKINVEQTTIRVKDIAQYRGPLDLRRKVMELLIEEVDQGKSALINTTTVRFRLMLENDIDFDVEVDGPELVLVQHRDANSIVDDAISRLKTELSQRYAVPEKAIVLELPASSLNLLRQVPDLDLATWKLPTSVDFPLGFKSLELVSRATQRSLRISTKIGLMQDIIVAKRLIPRGQKFDESSLEIARRPVFDPNIKLASLEQVVGKKARTDVQPFSTIQSRSIDQRKIATYDVKANELVIGIIESKHFDITVSRRFKARRSGKIGETIEVLNTQTNKTLYGEIVGKNKVRFN